MAVAATLATGILAGNPRLALYGGVLTGLLLFAVYYICYLFVTPARIHVCLTKEIEALKATIAKQQSSLEIAPDIIEFPRRRHDSPGSRFVVALGCYERYALRVRNESGQRLTDLLAMITYHPSQGNRAAIQGIWRETESKHIDLPFGDTGTLILGYSRGEHPGVGEPERAGVFSLEAPVSDLGVRALIDRWYLGRSALAQVRFTTDGIDQMTYLRLELALDEASAKVLAHIEVIAADAFKYWQPTPQPLEAYDLPVNVDPQSLWSEIQAAFRAVRDIAESARLYIHHTRNETRAELVLSPGISKKIEDRVVALSAIAGRKLAGGDPLQAPEQRWYLAVADSAGGGKDIGTRSIDGQPYAVLLVSNYMIASEELCLDREEEEERAESG